MGERRLHFILRAFINYSLFSRNLVSKMLFISKVYIISKVIVNFKPIQPDSCKENHERWCLPPPPLSPIAASEGTVCIPGLFCISTAYHTHTHTRARSHTHRLFLNQHRIMLYILCLLLFGLLVYPRYFYISVYVELPHSFNQLHGFPSCICAKLWLAEYLGF